MTSPAHEELSPGEIERRKAFLELSGEDAELLRRLAPQLQVAQKRIIERFYAHLLRFDRTRALIPDDPTLARLEKTQSRYFGRLFEGDYGRAYGDDRLRVGRAHYRVGLEPEWYLGAYALYLRLLLPEVRRLSAGDWDRALPILDAILKVVFLDVGLAIDAYRAADRRDLATTLASIGDAVISTDVAGRVTRMNRAAEALTGWPLAEALGRPLNEVFRILQEGTRAPAESPAARVLREGAVIGLANHTLLLSRDGTERPIADSGAPIQTAEGEILGVVLVFRDQTEEREAARALARSEARHRLLFDSSPLPRWVYDRETLRFLEVSAAAIQRYGYGRDEFLAMTIEDLLPAGDLPALRQAAAGLTAAGDSGVWHHRLKDGQLRSVELHSRDIDWDDRPARLVSVIDVTERERLAGQLRQAQKMEAMGRLAGGVAHDFNNLLSVILTYSHIIADGLAPGAAIREEIDEIRKAGERAAELTKQLLAFSRQQVLAPKVIDLNDVLARTEKMLRRVIGEDVVLHAVRAPALGRVLADEGQIEQVLMNLAVNARDAMPRGGQLTIETANVELDESFVRAHAGAKVGAHVRLAVRDTGVGMDEATRGRIFEPFFTTKEVGRGTGLGLATVLGIVQQSGGTIWVESEPGRGTTFEILLPRVDESGPLESVAPARAPGGGFESILLVEDEAALRSATGRILRGAGYRVLDVPGGAEALDLFERNDAAIDLLLTDVIMPEMSGPELARRLRALRPGLRVLCMSGYAGEAVLQHGLDSGVAFLAKPIVPAALLAKVREVLGAPG